MSSKKIAQNIAGRFQNYEVVALKKVTKFNKRKWMNCPWRNRGILIQWVSFVAQIKELQDKVLPCPMPGFFTILEQRASLESPTLPVIARQFRVQNYAWPRFWIAAYHTGCSGNFPKRFWTTTCSRRTSSWYIRKFREFGIIFSWSETKNLRTVRSGSKVRPEQQDLSNSK